MDPVAVCGCPGTATLFVNGTDLSDSTLAWSDEAGVNTGNPEGYYTENNIIYEVSADCGPGCITGSTISVYGNCPTVTPTITPTQTPTPSITSTLTPTPSSTPPIQGLFFTMTEVGPDVVLSGTGTANLSSLASQGIITRNISFIDPTNGEYNIGTIGGAVEFFSGVSLSSYPSFGSGSAVPADISAGDLFGITSSGVMVPYPYTGTLLNGRATFTGTTLSNLSANTGTYLVKWGSSGASETITLTIS
jgi:hypothetical protein